MNRIVWQMSVVTALFVGLVARANNIDCPSSLAEQVKQRKWRDTVTHSAEKNGYAPTNQTRESKIKSIAERMEIFIVDHTDVPEMEFVEAAGVKMLFTQTWQKNEMPAVTVSGLGSEGILRGTILLPVSGHLGLENAKKWSTTDTYKLYLEGPGKPVLLVKDAKSLAFITHHELEMPLKKGVTYKLTYHRSGSGGPAGFPGGRILEITWDGT